jgi:hypothetical protein
MTALLLIARPIAIDDTATGFVTPKDARFRFTAIDTRLASKLDGARFDNAAVRHLKTRLGADNIA